MITVREMSSEDIEICSEIYHDAFRHSKIMREYYDMKKYFTAFIESDSRYAYCVMNGDEVIWVITAVEIPDMLFCYTLYIDNFAIAPKHQKKGYGSEGLTQFIQLFSKDANIRLFTEDKLPAYKMYDKLGFLDMECAVMERSFMTKSIKRLKAETEKLREEQKELEEELNSYDH